MIHMRHMTSQLLTRTATMHSMLGVVHVSPFPRALPPSPPLSVSYTPCSLDQCQRPPAHAWKHSVFDAVWCVVVLDTDGGGHTDGGYTDGGYTDGECTDGGHTDGECTDGTQMVVHTTNHRTTFRTPCVFDGAPGCLHRPAPKSVGMQRPPAWEVTHLLVKLKTK